MRRSWQISLTPPTTTHASELDPPVASVGLRPAIRFAIAFPLTLAYLGYALCYQAITSATSLRGYWQYLRGARRHWR